VRRRGLEPGRPPRGGGGCRGDRPTAAGRRSLHRVLTRAPRAMPRHLHLVGPDAAALAAPVIAAEASAPDASVTVALLDGATAPDLPAGVSVVTVAPGPSGYASLLELIFASDRVTAW